MFYLIGVIVNRNSGKKSIGSFIFSEIYKSVLAYDELHILDSDDGITEVYTAQEVAEISRTVTIQEYDRSKQVFKITRIRALFRGRFQITPENVIRYNGVDIMDVVVKNGDVYVERDGIRSIFFTRSGASCVLHDICIFYSQKINNYYIITVGIKVRVMYVVGEVDNILQIQLVLDEKDFLGLYSVRFDDIKSNIDIVRKSWMVKDKTLLSKLRLSGVFEERKVLC